MAEKTGKSSSFAGAVLLWNCFSPPCSSRLLALLDGWTLALPPLLALLNLTPGWAPHTHTHSHARAHATSEYNPELAALCAEEKKYILRALQYCQDDASSNKGWWYIDKYGQPRGAYSTAQMKVWHDDGHFSNEMMVRKTPARVFFCPHTLGCIFPYVAAVAYLMYPCIYSAPPLCAATQQ